MAQKHAIKFFFVFVTMNFLEKNYAKTEILNILKYKRLFKIVIINKIDKILLFYLITILFLLFGYFLLQIHLM